LAILLPWKGRLSKGASGIQGEWRMTGVRELDEKLDNCRRILRDLGSVVVAVSGGTDSSFLLALAAGALGPQKVLAAVAVAGIFPERELQAARQIAKQVGVELVELATSPLTDAKFTSNPPDRCYYCKSRLLSRLKELAAERGFAHVATGTNADDAKDYRPGARAEKQMAIRCPLQEAQLTKEEIRLASRQMGLATWNSPSNACLATRIPYGQEITAEKLSRIERAEETLRGMGFSHLRVRDHDPVARIEVPADEIARTVEMREKIVPALRNLGYTYVTLDLQGLRSGSMNEALEPDARQPVNAVARRAIVS
jgi:uncharacterized protein